MRFNSIFVLAAILAALTVLVAPASAGDIQWGFYVVIPSAPCGGYNTWTPPPCGGYNNNWGYQPQYQPRYQPPQARYNPNATAYAEAFQSRTSKLERDERYRQENLAAKAGRDAADRAFYNDGNNNACFGTSQSLVPAE